MNLLKFIIVGAAVGYGINYVTKKGANGRSIIEDLADDAPEWFGKAKQLAEDALGKVSQKAEDIKASF
ncbi:MAG TPA: hypothetical protein VHA56_00510 [Mucilaginibacter sp.]|nr:hypothetical protein [Mucilaginibacter sp.]